MGQPAPQAATTQQTIVQRPRASDAIGVALRNSFARDQSLPEELAKLVRQLNGNGGMRSSY